MTGCNAFTKLLLWKWNSIRAVLGLSCPQHSQISFHLGLNQKFSFDRHEPFKKDPKSTTISNMICELLLFQVSARSFAKESTSKFTWIHILLGSLFCCGSGLIFDVDFQRSMSTKRGGVEIWISKAGAFIQWRYSLPRTTWILVNDFPKLPLCCDFHNSSTFLSPSLLSSLSLSITTCGPLTFRLTIFSYTFKPCNPFPKLAISISLSHCAKPSRLHSLNVSLRHQNNTGGVPYLAALHVNPLLPLLARQ